MDYRTRIVDSPADIDAEAWNSLLAKQQRPTPFLRHEFLSALTDAGCATAETGWAPRFVTLWRSRSGAALRTDESALALAVSDTTETLDFATQHVARET